MKSSCFDCGGLQPDQYCPACAADLAMRIYRSALQAQAQRRPGLPPGARRIYEATLHLAADMFPDGPSVREVGAAAGLRSSASPYMHLKRIAERGLLQWGPNKERAIRVLFPRIPSATGPGSPNTATHTGCGAQTVRGLANGTNGT